MRLPNIPSPQQGIDKMRDQISNVKQNMAVNTLKLQSQGIQKQDDTHTLTGNPKLSAFANICSAMRIRQKGTRRRL